MRSGEFRWVWYKLIHTNVHIAVFNPEHKKFPIDFQSSLPSGDTYTSFAGITNVDFSWNLQGEFVFGINPEMLVTLTEHYNLSGQEDLDRYLQNMSMDIELLIMRTLSSAETDSERLEQIMSGYPDAEMEQEISSRFPEIHDFSLIIHSAKYPNFLLYRQLRTLYEEFLASQRDFVSASFGMLAENQIQTQLRFSELERYGDLLTRFPVLLEFMRMESQINRAQ